MQIPQPNTAAAHLLRAIHESENEFYPKPSDLHAAIAAADQLQHIPGWRVSTVFRSTKGFIGAVPADFGHIGFCIERPASWRALVEPRARA
jgi:hypothetical protein